MLLSSSLLSRVHRGGGGGGHRRRSGGGGSKNLAVFISMIALVAISFSSVVVVVSASNPFSTNVVALTPSNWRKVVLETPHAVLVNICRVGCGYCQRLQPEWEKLAKSTKGIVTVAYWDTEQGSRPPRLLGDFQGTPTIRLFKAKKKQRKKESYEEKTVLDYQHGERNVKDLSKFLEYQIPNFVERVKFGRKDYDKAASKAAKYGLPVALLFTSKATTSNAIKWLSTEFRRRLLLVEIPPTTNNQNLRSELIGDDDEEKNKQLPALYILKHTTEGEDDSSSNIVAYDGDSFKRRNLEDFFRIHALPKPVYDPVVVAPTADNKDATDSTGSASGSTATESDDTKKEEKKKQTVGGHDEF